MNNITEEQFNFIHNHKIPRYDDTFYIRSTEGEVSSIYNSEESWKNLTTSLLLLETYNIEFYFYGKKGSWSDVLFRLLGEKVTLSVEGISSMYRLLFTYDSKYENLLYIEFLKIGEDGKVFTEDMFSRVPENFIPEKGFGKMTKSVRKL